MSDYNRSLRAYWWTSTLVGLAAVVYSVARVARMDRSDILGVIALVAMVVLVTFRPMRIPRTKSSITAGDIFMFLAAILFGAPGATLVAVTDAVFSSLRTTRRWTSRLGGPGFIAI